MGDALKKYILLSGLIALSGCTSEQTPLVAPKTAQPQNYKARIINHIKESFFDPYSIRDASISTPFAVNRIGHGEIWFVCVRANAKNRMGAYTGLKPTAYWFKNGNIQLASPTASEYDEFNCAHAKYFPFPEIENL